MKKLSLIIIALLAFTATAWAQQTVGVNDESDLRSKLLNSQYDGYTFNLHNDITIPSVNGEIEIRYRATINMNGKSIVAEDASIRIFHVMPQGSLPYTPSLTLTGNGTLIGDSGGTLNGGVIYNEGMLTLQNVTIQNATATNGGAVYNTGTMTMSGGSITGCNASTKGGGIYSKGTLTISGGSVTGNTAGNAGGINLDGCTFTMTGGTISQNSTIDNGQNNNCGGLNVTGGSTVTMSGGSIANNTADDNDGGVYIGSYSTLTMSGGSITGNSAMNNGGIRVAGNGTLNLTGGSITGNTVTNNYGGIWMNGTLNMSGNPIVSGNLAVSSTASNVYLTSGKTITVNGAFTEGANVHVTHADVLDDDGYRDFATGYATYNASTDPATVFRSDNAAYEVGLHVSTGAASLIAATHLYDVPYLNVDATGDHGMETRASCTKISSYTDSNPTLTQGWYVVDQSKTFGRITISGVVNIILADNTILTAQNCVYVPHGTALHIWAQSTNYSDNGGDNMGALFASSQEEGYSCIGGCGMEGAGFLYFHGGYILAGDGIDSPFNSAGIYGAVNFENGYGTNIYGGVIFAWGGENAAGIGSQQLGICGNILITGGNVTALGGLKAAGIGSGFGGRTHEPLGGYSTNPDDDGGYTIIRITGGTVTAIGTSGAGIGGGEAENEVEYEGSPAIVYIDGGTVIARTQSSSAVIFDGIRTGAVAIGWGDEGMIAYNCLHIYDNAKVLATDDINDEPILQTKANGRDYTHFKQMTILPCDHPEGNHYTDNGSSLHVCDYCYTKEPYTFQSAGNWNDASKWLGNFRPDNDEKTGNDVAVKAAATVPSGCTANVGNIDMQEGGSLTIADGGQLKHSNAVPGTIQKHITGYGQTTNPEGWYLLGAPILIDSALAVNSGMVDLTNGNIDFTTHDIDLYDFDQSQDLEWENMRIGNRFHLMGLNVNHAYLYARANDATLNFSTTDDRLFAPTSEDKLITVLRVTNGASLAGYNLISNPFTCNAYLASGRDFWRMNATGDAIVLANADNGGNAIKPCEGVFVMVAAENDPDPYTVGESVIPNVAKIRFTTTEPEPAGGAKGLLDIKVSHNSQLADVARVRFGNGERSGKLVLDETATRLSITQDGKDYSVVHNEAQGEIPVSFKAKADGTYTLSLGTEEVAFNYLHLIDNMTGNDVDMLANPSYTFEAKTTDYESRFKLVFVADGENGPSTGSGTFAFFSNGEIIVNGEGTLQVFDVLGRQVLTKELSTVNCQLSTVNFPVGVYVLRLIDGNDVRTQKIVID